MKQHNYEVIPFPKLRSLIIDTGRIGRRKHTVHGLLEVDVTETRRQIRQYRVKTGRPLSLTAFIVFCLGRAVDENKQMHAYRNWRNQLILFDQVDVSILIEIAFENRKFPFSHIIRAANKKNLQEIEAEIHSIQNHPEKSESFQRKQMVQRLLLLPAFMRDLIYWFTSQSPHLVKKYLGTVAVSAVGMFGEGRSWGIPLTSYTLNITLGGVTKKPGVAHRKIAVREYLGITISVDHDIIDGAPAARFAQHFKKLIERGYGLDFLHEGAC
ncbi:MAG: 2-oxo acid dehydrogenase subunit E2 [Leptolyngbyaceae cyanobacterium MO_188.B28]|nr:2-oxo acid dehydrogenase subunit E2 [Leptolyngbyaceae cyanobacterium MO_188.B28]